ncbi:MAG: hypothetical protein ABUL72_05110, partial [Armatimonadota bacterium]
DRSYAGILDRIIVVGAPAQLSGFTQALSKTLAIRVEPHLPTYGLEIDSDDVSFMRLASRPAGFTVALGLAASHYGRPAPVQQEEESSEFVWSRIGF